MQVAGPLKPTSRYRDVAGWLYLLLSLVVQAVKAKPKAVVGYAATFGFCRRHRRCDQGCLPDHILSWVGGCRVLPEENSGWAWVDG